MKLQVKIIFCLLIVLNNLAIFAKSSEKKDEVTEFKYPYDYRVVASEITKETSPYQKDDYVIFTHKTGPRHVGIAFDFEDYKEIHSFMKKSTTDMDNNITGSCYFYILDIPKNKTSISYRLIIDGIWTTDPLNVSKTYNPYTGIEVSTLALINHHIDETKITDNGVHFIYQGQSGQVVRLGGTFTNWDSWIYELTETKPGYYELYLPLPEGTYYYAYYTGSKTFADVSNPNRAWSKDGRETSKLVIE